MSPYKKEVLLNPNTGCFMCEVFKLSLQLRHFLPFYSAKTFSLSKLTVTDCGNLSVVFFCLSPSACRDEGL